MNIVIQIQLLEEAGYISNIIANTLGKGKHPNFPTMGK